MNHKLPQALVTTFGIKAGAAFASLLLLVLTSRLFGAEGRGVISIALVLMQTSLLIHGILGGAAFAQSLAGEKNRIVIKDHVAISGLWAIFSAFMVYASAKFFNLVPDGLLNICLVGCITISISSISSLLVLSAGELNKYNLHSFIQNTLIAGLFSVAAIIYYPSEKNFLISCVISQAITSLIYAYIFNKYYLNYTYIKSLSQKRKTFSELGRKGIFAQLSNLAFLYTSRSSLLILTGYGLLSEAGQLSVVLAISESISIISGSFSIVLFNMISQSSKKDDVDNINVIAFSKVSFIFTLAASIIITLIPNGIFIKIFGNTFMLTHTMLLLLLPAMAAEGAISVLMFYFSGRGMFLLNLKSTVSALIVSLIAAPLLISKFGILGAGVSISLSSGLLLFLLIREYCNINNIKLRNFIISKKDILEMLNLVKNKLHS